MTVEVYICEKFQHRHERKAFGRFLQEMLDRFRESTDLYIIVGEPETNTASMDMMVITHRALIVVELKELTYAEGLSKSQVTLCGKENGAWEYSLDGGSTYKMGGVNKDRNPYQQVKKHNYKLRDWLTSHTKFLPGGPWTKEEAIRKFYSWVVISPGFNKETSDLDLPWHEIRRWFKILSIDELAWEVETSVNADLTFSDEQMTAIARQLGGTRVENLQEFVPNYVPPAPRLSFFSRPPISKRIVDRHGERKNILTALKDPQVSIVCIGGPGGIGKTYLATWAASEAIQQNFDVLWVDCNEREVTQEAILTAIADKMSDHYQAALIHNPDQKTSDKLEVALSFLDQKPCILVLNDYHRLSNPNGLEELFTYIIHKTWNVKVLLTTRIRPEVLDSPGWTPGSVVELSLGGLPYEMVQEYISVENLSSEQLLQLWKRTSGNPYAIALFTSILRYRPWETNISALPLFNDEQASQWAGSLIENLNGEARTLASRVAVIKTPVYLDLIESLINGPREKAYLLIRELIDCYVLNEAGADRYQIHDYVREALISKTTKQELLKAHQKAGNYFVKLENQIEDRAGKIEAWLQALYHYEESENWSEVMKIAGHVYDSLVARGDRSRSCSVATQAAKAARALGDTEQTVEWLIKQIRRELDLRQLDSAQKHLNEGINLIPKSERRLKGDAKTKWQSLEAQVWALKGRLLHFRKDYSEMKACLTKAVDLANSSGDRMVIADTLFRVTQLQRLHRDYVNAKKHSEEAGNLASKLGDKRLLAMSISQLGLITREQGNLEEARRLFLLAQEKAIEGNDVNGLQINKGLLGDILLRLEEYEEAEQVFTSLLEKSREIGNSLSIRINLGWLIDSLIGSNQLERAAENLTELKQRVEDACDEIGIAFYLKRVGQLEQKRGDIDKGNDLIVQGRYMLEESGNHAYIPDFEKAIITTPSPKQLALWS